MTKPITITTLTNGDGVLDPYKRQQTGKNKGAADCVKITIPKGTKIWGQVTKRTTTKVVSFSRFFGKDFDYLGSPEERAKLIYNPQSPISSTTLRNSLAEVFGKRSELLGVNVRWASTARATERFKALVKKHESRYQKLWKKVSTEWEQEFEMYCMDNGEDKACPPEYRE